LENKEILQVRNSAPDRSTRHIVLDITGFPKENKNIYEEGDHVGILPENDPELVAALLQRLDIKQPNAYFSLQIDDSETKPTHIPPICTFQNALMRYVDITSPMNIHAFEILLRYCSDETEKKRFRNTKSWRETL